MMLVGEHFNLYHNHDMEQTVSTSSSNRGHHYHLQIKVIIIISQVWTTFTGLMGCLANSTAICLFLKSRKVMVMVMMIGVMMVMMTSDDYNGHDDDMKMLITVTDPFQLGVDESLPHRAGDRSEWQHRPCHQLFLQVIIVKGCGVMVVVVLVVMVVMMVM